MRNYLIIIFLLLFFAKNHAQPKRGTGLILNDAKYRETPTLSQFEGVKYNNVPLKFSLRPYCPVVGDQYETSTCVGWAVGYGALTIAKATALGMKNTDSITQIAHSAFYIYNRVATDCKVGAELSAALNLVHTEGDCLSRTFSNDIKNCEKNPTENAKQEAYFYKIKDYITVFRIEDAPNVKIKKMQQTLAAGNPIVVALNIGNSFYQIKKNDEFWLPSKNEVGDEAHAMVVVGYDAVKGWFELMNSWGSGWADGGFIKVKTEDFVRFARYAYQILPEDRSLLRGGFSFRTVKKGGDEFDNTKVYYDGETKTYKTEQARWQIGDIFQLAAHNLPKGKYVYVFSFDAKNQLTIHFPLDNKNVFMPNSDAELIIPDPETAMQISEAGEDNLCVLYADYAIPDLKKRLSRVENATGDVKKRLKAGFEDILIDETNVNYKPDDMQCEVVRNSEKKYVVAMILSIKAL
ncbi:MAG: C1 family peptidase [Saprospiraceae bacterium]|nr:C1 family peptidase [Saprospiraceae bacterium]